MVKLQAPKHHQTFDWNPSSRNCGIHLRSLGRSHKQQIYLTENCGILNRLLPGDVTLADHGFDIAELCGQSYIYLLLQEVNHNCLLSKWRKLIQLLMSGFM